MSSTDALNVESLLLASETCPRRLELYDSGATNMFRALATNAIAGSERPLERVRKVAAADSGLTAERTYLETFNMLSADGTTIYSAIISPFICPKMRKTMSVSSAHKLGELGFGQRRVDEWSDGSVGRVMVSTR